MAEPKVEIRGVSIGWNESNMTAKDAAKISDLLLSRLQRIAPRIIKAAIRDGRIKLEK